MNTRTRRGFRATAAVAIAGSLIGVQALVSAATADATIPWTPDQAAPSSTGFWSNTCPTTEPGNLHDPAVLSDDSANIASTRTLVVGPNGLPDAAWHYTPGPNSEGGISLGALSQKTTALSVAVNGATTGRLVVMYTDGKGIQFVGEQQFTTTSGWQTASAGQLTWYRSFIGLNQQPYWAAPNNLLNTNGWNGTLDQFFTQFGDGTTNFSAAFQFGCTGAFALDHLSKTDNAVTTQYDLQNPASATTTSASASTISATGSTTINAAVTLAADGTTPVTDGTLTLQSSPDGTTWTDVSTHANGAGFSVAPRQRTQYRVNFEGAADAAASQSSNAVTIDVSPAVTLKTSRTSMHTGNSATFTASFAPVSSGVSVTFQQRSGTSWQTIGTAPTNSSGVATLTKSRSSSGLWTVRAYAAAQGGFLVSNAPSVSVKVYQPVSIAAYRSVTSVYTGRYFRIYGTVTPRSSGISLQLQQYVSRRWIIVATGHTGTRGAYSFSKLARTPGVATFRVIAPASGYRLRGGSVAVKVTIVRAPVYTPPPPPPSGGGGGGGSGIG